MAESKRAHGYFGMTTTQVVIVVFLAIVNCLALIVGAVLVLAYQPLAAGTIANDQPTPLATVSQPMATQQPIRTLQPVATPQPTSISTAVPAPAGGQVEIAKLETLDSYRLRLSMSMTSEYTSTAVGWNITQEWVKASLAQHTIMSMEGLPSSAQGIGMSIETITISNTTWFKVGDAWTRVDFQQPQYQQSGLESLGSYFHDMQLAGEETINDIHCKHYTVDEDIMRVSGQGRGNMTFHAQGDLWIANQSDLPSIIVRMQMQMRMQGLVFPIPIPSAVPEPKASEQQEIIYYLNYNLIDINTPIIIEPPQELHG